MKTLFLDIMIGEYYKYTLKYKYSPAFALDPDDIVREVYRQKPSLRGQQFTIHTDKLVITP